jgi:hypothetical protein
VVKRKFALSGALRAIPSGEKYQKGLKERGQDKKARGNFKLKYNLRETAQKIAKWGEHGSLATHALKKARRGLCPRKIQATTTLT